MNRLPISVSSSRDSLIDVHAAAAAAAAAAASYDPTNLISLDSNGNINSQRPSSPGLPTFDMESLVSSSNSASISSSAVAPALNLASASAYTPSASLKIEDLMMMNKGIKREEVTGANNDDELLLKSTKYNMNDSSSSFPGKNSNDMIDAQPKSPTRVPQATATRIAFHSPPPSLSTVNIVPPVSPKAPSPTTSPKVAFKARSSSPTPTARPIPNPGPPLSASATMAYNMLQQVQQRQAASKLQRPYNSSPTVRPRRNSFGSDGMIELHSGRRTVAGGSDNDSDNDSMSSRHFRSLSASLDVTPDSRIRPFGPSSVVPGSSQPSSLRRDATSSSQNTSPTASIRRFSPTSSRMIASIVNSMTPSAVMAHRPSTVPSQSLSLSASLDGRIQTTISSGGGGGATLGNFLRQSNRDPLNTTTTTDLNTSLSSTKSLNLWVSQWENNLEQSRKVNKQLQDALQIMEQRMMEAEERVSMQEVSSSREVSSFAAIIRNLETELIKKEEDLKTAFESVRDFKNRAEVKLLKQSNVIKELEAGREAAAQKEAQLQQALADAKTQLHLMGHSSTISAKNEKDGNKEPETLTQKEISMLRDSMLQKMKEIDQLKMHISTHKMEIGKMETDSEEKKKTIDGLKHALIMKEAELQEEKERNGQLEEIVAESRQREKIMNDDMKRLTMQTTQMQQEHESQIEVFNSQLDRNNEQVERLVAGIKSRDQTICDFRQQVQSYETKLAASDRRCVQMEQHAMDFHLENMRLRKIYENIRNDLGGVLPKFDRLSLAFSAVHFTMENQAQQIASFEDEIKQWQQTAQAAVKKTTSLRSEKNIAQEAQTTVQRELDLVYEIHTSQIQHRDESAIRIENVMKQQLALLQKNDVTLRAALGDAQKDKTILETKLQEANIEIEVLKAKMDVLEKEWKEDKISEKKSHHERSNSANSSSSNNNNNNNNNNSTILKSPPRDIILVGHVPNENSSNSSNIRIEHMTSEWWNQWFADQTSMIELRTTELQHQLLNLQQRLYQAIQDGRSTGELDVLEKEIQHRMEALALAESEAQRLSVLAQQQKRLDNRMKLF